MKLFYFITTLFLFSFTSSCNIDYNKNLPIVYINPIQYNEKMCNTCLLISLKSFDTDYIGNIPLHAFTIANIGGICKECPDKSISFDKYSDGSELNVNWKTTSCNLRKN